MSLMGRSAFGRVRHFCAAALGIAIAATVGASALSGAAARDRTAAAATAATSVVAGAIHTCALLATGRVKCWGANQYGKLGDGTQTDRLTPVTVRGLASNVVGIAAGGDHNCVRTSAGTVKCWGYNRYGQLGNGSQQDGLVAGNVIGLAGRVSRLAAGDTHTCAILAGTSALQCWGHNEYGQLGDETRIGFRLNPVFVKRFRSGTTAVSAGATHTCALNDAGGLKCWGLNRLGQLGDGSLTTHYMPVFVKGLKSGAARVNVGREHTCAGTTAGGVKCWGSNSDGQLGDGTTEYHRLPAFVRGLASGVRVVVTGYFHSCALTNAGGVKCWGRNEQGRLGDGTRTQRLTPVDVVGLTSGVRGIAVGYAHSCAVTNAGKVKCWGGSNFGQLGNGSINDALTPVEVKGL